MIKTAKPKLGVCTDVTEGRGLGKMFQQKQSDCERSPEAPVPPSNRASPPSLQLLQVCDVKIGPGLPEDTAPIFHWLNDVESTVLDMSYRPVDWMKYNQWL